MRNHTILSLLAAAALGVCFQSGTAQANGVAGPSQRSAVGYTNIAAATAAPAAIIPVRIDVQFGADERAKILEAIRHWNHTLNGQIRFEIAAAYNVNAPHQHAGQQTGQRQRNTWIVARVSGTGAMPAGVMPGRGPQLGATLAQTQTLATDGGMVLVFADKIGQRDLGGIMLHELGHVLGLGHENAGRLMAPHYTPTAQQCIDKGAVQAVAQAKSLAFEKLNWCGDAAAVAAATRSQGRMASR